MKLLTWNILKGGSRERFDNIAQTLINHNADVIILTEYWDENGEVIRNALENAGWVYQLLKALCIMDFIEHTVKAIILIRRIQQSFKNSIKLPIVGIMLYNIINV